MSTTTPSLPAAVGRPLRAVPSGAPGPLRGTAPRAAGPDRYRLASGVTVVDRGPGSLQIGTEPPRCVVLDHAPPDAASVLSRLDGRLRLADLVAEADLPAWLPVVTDLLDTGVLDRAPDDLPDLPTGTWVSAERAALGHQHGAAAAARALGTRADAVVAIRGGGALAGAIAGMLAAAGIGRVHRTGTSIEPTAAAAAPAPTSDRSAVRFHAPAAHLPATLTVIADHRPIDPADTAVLTWQALPHLIVQVSSGRAVVGPMVLPGRSSCLACTHRYRSEQDPAWPAVWRAMRRAAQPAAAVLSHAAATLAAREALTLIDNLAVPATVDGTLEWALPDLGPRRRSWPRHPDCGCDPR